MDEIVNNWPFNNPNRYVILYYNNIGNQVHFTLYYESDFSCYIKIVNNNIKRISCFLDF